MNLEFDFRLIGLLSLSILYIIAGVAVLKTDYRVLCIPLIIIGFAIFLMTIVMEILDYDEEDDEDENENSEDNENGEEEAESELSVSSRVSYTVINLRERRRSKSL